MKLLGLFSLYKPSFKIGFHCPHQSMLTFSAFSPFVLAPTDTGLSVHSSMSEGESQTVLSSGSDPKVESSSSAPGLTSVSPPVTSTTSAASPEEEEEESEDESEILEESPCGRWQKRREEVKG